MSSRTGDDAGRGGPIGPPALRRALLVAAFLGAGGAPIAAGENVDIEFFGSSFLPQNVTVEVGDTVTFVRQSGEHTVTSGEGPDDPEAGELFDEPLDEDNPRFVLEVIPEHGDGLTFFDRRNPGPVGFIEISGGERTVRVGVVDNAYVPDVVWIFEGDSVRWEHEPMEAFHTVTSGRSSRPEDDPGALFDEPSSEENPIFVYRFEDGGDYPYFCRPHEELGMTGMVHVQDLFLRGDTTGEGRIDLTDAITTLNWLFLGAEAPSCEDAADANDDGGVDLGDAVFTLGYLFLGESPMPPPWPFEGADRTEDGLRCR